MHLNVRHPAAPFFIQETFYSFLPDPRRARGPECPPAGCANMTEYWAGTSGKDGRDKERKVGEGLTIFLGGEVGLGFRAVTPPGGGEVKSDPPPRGGGGREAWPKTNCLINERYLGSPRHPLPPRPVGRGGGCLAPQREVFNLLSSSIQFRSPSDWTPPPPYKRGGRGRVGLASRRPSGAQPQSGEEV